MEQMRRALEEERGRERAEKKALLSRYRAERQQREMEEARRCSLGGGAVGGGAAREALALTGEARRRQELDAQEEELRRQVAEANAARVEWRVRACVRALSRLTCSPPRYAEGGPARQARGDGS
jgi:hypothetical protein